MLSTSAIICIFNTGSYIAIELQKQEHGSFSASLAIVNYCLGVTAIEHFATDANATPCEFLTVKNVCRNTHKLI